MVDGTHFCIGLVLQPLLIALLAMRKGVATDIVQRITIGQLGCSQRRELDRIRMQFQLGRDHLFHRTSVRYFTGYVKYMLCEVCANSSPRLKTGEELAQFVETQFLGDYGMPQGENWLTTEEIAKDLKVNVNTVRRWIQSGELVALDVGGEYRVSREDYNDFVRRRKTDKRKRDS
jgi:excisionase family DNA binding protein